MKGKFSVMAGQPIKPARVRGRRGIGTYKSRNLLDLNEPKTGVKFFKKHRSES